MKWIRFWYWIGNDVHRRLPFHKRHDEKICLWEHATGHILDNRFLPEHCPICRFKQRWRLRWPVYRSEK